MVVSNFGAEGDVSKESSDKIKFPYGWSLRSNYLRCWLAVGSAAELNVSVESMFHDVKELFWCPNSLEIVLQDSAFCNQRFFPKVPSYQEGFTPKM